MSLIEAEIDRAVAVVLSRSTASAVPSPTRLPNETEAPSVGGSVSLASSASSSRRRSSRDRRVSSRSRIGESKLIHSFSRQGVTYAGAMDQGRRFHVAGLP